ncbi:Myosin tail [Halocaridina rubra]|uniref:Myosin tail n=1 Tax=Halocaridina rubra TaxID=373956 RepID=A0AAN8XPY5_HALRR
MGNTQAVPPSTVAESQQPESAAAQLARRTTNLADAINTLAPAKPSSSKAEETPKQESRKVKASSVHEEQVMSRLSEKLKTVLTQKAENEVSAKPGDEGKVKGFEAAGTVQRENSCKTENIPEDAKAPNGTQTENNIERKTVDSSAAGISIPQKPDTTKTDLAPKVVSELVTNKAPVKHTSENTLKEKITSEEETSSNAESSLYIENVAMVDKIQNVEALSASKADGIQVTEISPASRDMLLSKVDNKKIENPSVSRGIIIKKTEITPNAEMSTIAQNSGTTENALYSISDSETKCILEKPHNLDIQSKESNASITTNTCIEDATKSKILSENTSKEGNVLKSGNIEEVEKSSKPGNSVVRKGTFRIQNSINEECVTNSETVAKSENLSGASNTKESPADYKIPAEQVTIDISKPSIVTNKNGMGNKVSEKDQGSVNHIPDQVSHKQIHQNRSSQITSAEETKPELTSSINVLSEKPDDNAAFVSKAPFTDSGKIPDSIDTKHEKSENDVGNTEPPVSMNSAGSRSSTNQDMPTVKDSTPSAGKATKQENKIENSGVVDSDIISGSKTSPGKAVKEEVKNTSQPSVISVGSVRDAGKPAPLNRKQRAGSPVPDKSAVLGIKITAPVLKGKLEITPNSGPGPPETDSLTSTKASSDTSTNREKDSNMEVMKSSPVGEKDMNTSNRLSTKPEKDNNVQTVNTSPVDEKDTSPQASNTSFTKLENDVIKVTKNDGHESENISSPTKSSNSSSTKLEENSNMDNTKTSPVGEMVQSQAKTSNYSSTKIENNTNVKINVSEKEREIIVSDAKGSNIIEEVSHSPKAEELLLPDNKHILKGTKGALGISNSSNNLKSKLQNNQAKIPIRSASESNKSNENTNISNGVDNFPDKDEDFDDISEIETFMEMSSRRSSVASDTSRTISPDMSLRTGGKRAKSEKLAAMMNLWENDDISQISERTKPKLARSTPKVGKISGIKNMFEAGKAGDKVEPVNNPNLVKLKSPSASVITDPKSPVTAKKLPGAVGITSANVAKFGGTSKFKKPSEVKEVPSLKREKSSISNSTEKENTDKVLKSNQRELTDTNSKKDNKGIGADAKIKPDEPMKNNVEVEKEGKNKLNEDVEKDKEVIAEKTSEKQEGKKEKIKDTKVDIGKQVHDGQSSKEHVNKSEIISNGTPGVDEISQSKGSDGKDVKKKKKKRGEKTEGTNNALDKPLESDVRTDSKEKVSVDDGKVSSIQETVPASECKDVTVHNISADNKATVTEKISDSEVSKSQAKTASLVTVSEKPAIGKIKKNDILTGSSDMSKVQDDKGDSNGTENKGKSGKKLGGIKSFIESVAKGGKTLEDKLSKTGLHVGKKSSKLDSVKNSPSTESETPKKFEQSSTSDGMSSLGVASFPAPIADAALLSTTNEKDSTSAIIATTNEIAPSNTSTTSISSTKGSTLIDSFCTNENAVVECSIVDESTVGKDSVKNEGSVGKTPLTTTSNAREVSSVNESSGAKSYRKYKRGVKNAVMKEEIPAKTATVEEATSKIESTVTYDGTLAKSPVNDEIPDKTSTLEEGASKVGSTFTSKVAVDKSTLKDNIPVNASTLEEGTSNVGSIVSSEGAVAKSPVKDEIPAKTSTLEEVTSKAESTVTSEVADAKKPVNDKSLLINAQKISNESSLIKAAEDLGKTKLERKEKLAKAIPALESEVEALIKQVSVHIKPEKAVRPNSFSTLRRTLPEKEVLSVASFPDTPFGGEYGVTSLPSSPTKDKEFFVGSLPKSIMSLPSSPIRELQFPFDETQKTPTSEEGEEEVFVDAIDPAQLDTLMPLPEVQNERDRRSRSRTPMDIRERSVTPSPIVAQTEAILSETDRLLRRSRSNKSLRRSYSRSLSNAALNKLSEVSADLSEEHTTAHLAGERLEAEQAERMKLEKEVDRLQSDMKRMTTQNDKLEMEKLALHSEILSAAELNGDIDDDEAADASLYKRKYEWCLREMELLKKQLKQQQEDDLDQLLLLKKQLEKKVADAYEETDEQRQVVAQMKRKSQRLQAEMNDLKILLEEQTSRNNLLEKKQRKFDQEVLSVQEELRHERTNKDKIQRERDQILSEKYSFEQEVTTLKLELELKEEKVSALNRELDDLTSSGKVEEEVATLKKAKHDLELRIKDQEEELDDLAGQVQMLEGAKVRLEMSMEQMRKEHRREVSQREEELEDVRISAQKKIKSLEAQLENEHEERTLLVREKHELERRIADLQDRTITHVDEDYVHKLKKELKKTKALLRDTQTMLEKAQSEGSHKLILRQLKTQLEDAEFAKTAAIKARQCAEADLGEINGQLDETLRSKKDAEDKCARVTKEKAEIQTQLEESEEEVAEVMKKYKAVVSQLSVDQITLSEQSQQIAELEHSKQVLQERMMELSSKVEVLEGETANIHTQRRLEMKIKEMESKLELELTTRQRLESQIGRLKDQIERLSGECDTARMKEAQALDQSKRLGRQLRDAREDLSNIQQRHTEASNKKSELEKQLELADSEVITLKSDLKLAFKRIEDLQQAIQGDLSDSDSDLSDSDSDSDGSLSSYLTASLKHQRSSSNSTLRTPPSEIQQLERLDLPNSPCSDPMSVISEDIDDASTKESFA